MDATAKWPRALVLGEHANSLSARYPLDMALTTAAGTRGDLFDDVHDDFRESFRRFLEAEVVPNQDAWQEAHIVDRSLFAKAGENGFFALPIE